MNITFENAAVWIAITTFAVWLVKCLHCSPLEKYAGISQKSNGLQLRSSILDSKIDQHDTRSSKGKSQLFRP